MIPKLTGSVINNIVIQQSPARVQDSLLLLTGVSLACALFSGLRGSCFLIINTKMNVRIRARLFAALMQQEIGFFDTTKTGEISSRLSADVNKMSDQIGLNVNVCLRSVVQAATLLAFMLASQWQLTVVTFVSVPLVSIVSKVSLGCGWCWAGLGLRRLSIASKWKPSTPNRAPSTDCWLQVYGAFYRELTMALQDQQAVCNANAEEIIGSMRTVRACGAEGQEVGAYVGGLHLILALGYRQALAYVGYMFFVMGAPLLVTVAVLYFGAHMVLHHGLEPGDMVTLHPKPHTIHPQP